MANILPGELLNSFTALTLTDVAQLVIEHIGKGRKLTVAELRAAVLASVTANVATIETTVDTEWRDPLTLLTQQSLELADAGHTHTKADIGLSNVANLAPLDLPVSTAVQDALDFKLDDGGTVPVIEEWVSPVPPEW